MNDINVTTARKGQENYLAALLYDDVNVVEQWENDREIAVAWTRDSDFLRQYQADRLSSGWFPTRTGFDGLTYLVDEFELSAPCFDTAPPVELFTVVGTATYDANTDTLEV